MAFAIPPRAWINPGPETTRQTPGLQTNNKKFIVHYSKDGVSENDLHINPIKYQGKNKKKKMTEKEIRKLLIKGWSCGDEIHVMTINKQIINT